MINNKEQLQTFALSLGDKLGRIISIGTCLCERALAHVPGLSGQKFVKRGAVDCVHEFSIAPVAPVYLPSREHLIQAGKLLDDRLRPPGTNLKHCDWNFSEQVFNVVTSVPYALVGAHLYRKTNKPWHKVYAASQVGVGGVAAMYHASDGKLRKWMRRADYWMIALASASLTRALYPEANSIVTSLSVAATPFLPFLTSSANTIALEAKYLQRAAKNSDLQKHHCRHLLAGGAGLTLFTLDEVHPRIPGIHAAWHMLSCFAVYETLPLLQDCTQNAV